MTRRIFRSVFFAALAVFLASLAMTVGVLYRYFSNVQQTQLRQQTGFVARGVQQEGEAYFEGLDMGNYRATWIGEDGTVLYDNRADISGMENHLQREEIGEALLKGYGESDRYSSTLTERFLYCARRLPDGTVLRLSIVQHTVLSLLFGMVQPVAFIFLAAILLSVVLAMQLSDAIVKPLNKLDLDHPLSNEKYEELSPLLRRIDSQQKQLKQQSEQLLRKQEELDAVIGNMKEGLILLNPQGRILSINPAALSLFHADSSSVGENILTVSRNLEMQDALARALLGEHTEKVLELEERHFQLDASPAKSEEHVFGAVLLLFDVTEKERLEQMRREFTANVSHELKTPLHSICGCAELLKNKMVKEEDILSFAEKIYMEARRMARLVEDIIHLSHLDEGAAGMEYETVDLYSVAQSAVQNLAQEAEAASVAVELRGGSAYVYGSPQLLYGIVFNLCDNAVKYNHSGGSVTVAVEETGQSVNLRVEDTGIGIPKEHQERIFERFYRVDKSRSREAGGTGLGLSIVKHAVKLHHAKISMKSTAGVGTAITVGFPKN